MDVKVFKSSINIDYEWFKNGRACPMIKNANQLILNLQTWHLMFWVENTNSQPVKPKI